MSNFGMDTDWDDDILDIDVEFMHTPKEKRKKKIPKKILTPQDDLEKVGVVPTVSFSDIVDVIEDLETDKPDVPLGRTLTKSKEVSKKIKYRVVSPEEFIRLKNEFNSKQNMASTTPPVNVVEKNSIQFLGNKEKVQKKNINVLEVASNTPVKAKTKSLVEVKETLTKSNKALVLKATKSESKTVSKKENTKSAKAKKKK